MGSMFRKLRRSLEKASMNHPESKWRELLADFSDWLYDVFISKPRQLKESLEKVIGWIPIVWKNHDWDSHYLFEVMRYKLQRMEKCIRKYGHAVNSEETADEIKKAVLLLDRICKRDYLDNALKGHEEYWGKVNMGSEKIEGKPYISRLIWRYEKNLTDKQKERERKEFRQRGNHADYMEKQDIEYLLKYINKHHKKWWD